MYGVRHSIVTKINNYQLPILHFLPNAMPLSALCVYFFVAK